MSEEDKKTIDYLKKELPELKKAAFKNYHLFLLKIWLIPIGVIFAVLAICFVIGGYFPSKTPPLLSPSDLEIVAQTSIAPSMTISGLFVTIMPVITFFFITEIKDSQREEEEKYENMKSKFKETEDLKVINDTDNLTNALYHNFRSGILRYLRTYLAGSLMSLFVMLCSYIGFSRIQMALYIFVDIACLAIVFMGIFPIVIIALNLPTLKLKTYVIPQQIVEQIEYES
jgi:hypothetical protein